MSVKNRISAKQTARSLPKANWKLAFSVYGEYFAYENNCSHQGGPVCQGKILNKVEEILAEDKTSKGLKFSEEDVHIVCPWHGYEFNIRTGRHPGDKNVRLKPYDVKVDNGEIYVVV